MQSEDSIAMTSYREQRGRFAMQALDQVILMNESPAVAMYLLLLLLLLFYRRGKSKEMMDRITILERGGAGGQKNSMTLLSYFSSLIAPPGACEYCMEHHVLISLMYYDKIIF